jgi:DNA invertase Pin-like site-specific DNA recombinase
MRSRTPEPVGSRPLRCAVYTRVSTTDQLKLEFNSLDAQRDASELYIRSQAHLGWQVIPTRYDDGGFTGKNIDRPAFTRLIDDIEAGKVDVVVVYKLDRLCRSLLDFARVMDRFNAVGCAFVSVTQNFSTADAMGRLTLHILMSFAEFEREMIAERTRDKIVATRRKGLWTGGPIPLGYTVQDKRLVLEEYEASMVREAFELFLRHRQVASVARELNDRQRLTKSQLATSGRRLVRAWTKDSVARLLRNPVYAGLVRCKDEVHRGEHEAIVSREDFDRAQALLNDRGRAITPAARNPAYILTGLLRCSICGGALSPGSTRKGGHEYRYYRCCTRDKHGKDRCPAPPQPAEALESYVADRIATTARGSATISEFISAVNSRITARREELLRERKRLPSVIARLSAEARDKLQVIAKFDGTVRAAAEQQLERLYLRIAELEHRISSATQQLAVLDEEHVTAEWVAATLADFQRVWDQLTLPNRSRLLRALVQAVVVDGLSNRVAIHLLNPTSAIILNSEANIESTSPAPRA